VRADGDLGRFITGDVDDKVELLRSDGVAVRNGKVDLNCGRFREFRCRSELKRLRQIQYEMLSELSLVDQSPQSVVAGVDVSYIGSDGVAAYVEVDAAGDPLWSTTIRKPIRFPYISSYLAFRELPLLLDLLAQVREQRAIADAVLVDGSGIAHPRRTGIATMLGIAAEIPTIGVTKRLLHGRVDLGGLVFGQARPILDGGATIGYATLAWPKTRKPIYLSPGHLVSVESAAEIVRRSLGTRRLPSPIYWADRISRAEATG
jgi:deoxyribonuclease V